MNYRIEEADDMPFERWTAYMWACLLGMEKQTSHFITRDSQGQSWIKLKNDLN